MFTGNQLALQPASKPFEGPRLALCSMPLGLICHILYKISLGACEMAQSIQVLATKPGDLCSILGTNMVEAKTPEC